MSGLAPYGTESFYGARNDLRLNLSGGGFRAAAFHLGVVRWLFDSGALPFVNEIWSVSGGSLVSAWMWKNRDWLFDSGRPTAKDFDQAFCEPLRGLLVRDVRTVPILCSIGINMFWKGLRIRLLEREFRRLFDLREAVSRGECGPRFGLVAFSVQKRRSVVLDPDDQRLSRQVAASAAFPPFFGPVALDGDAFLDGGLGTNLGIEPAHLHEWRCLLVSDASRGAPDWLSSRFSPVWLKALALIKSGSDRVARQFLVSSDSDSVIVSIAPLPIADWFNDLPSQFDRRGLRVLARLRTDLAGFDSSSVRQLEAAGYELARECFGEQLRGWALRLEGEEPGWLPDQVGLAEWLHDWLDNDGY